MMQTWIDKNPSWEYMLWSEDNIPPLVNNKVESREAIKPRISQLDLDVRISTHLAPDILSLHFCSCDDSHGSFHVLLQGF